MGKAAVQGHPEGLQTEVTLSIVGTLKNPFEDKLESESSRENPRETNGDREKLTSKKHQQDTAPSTASGEIMMPPENPEQGNCDMG